MTQKDFVLYKLPNNKNISYHKITEDGNTKPSFIFNSFDGKTTKKFSLINTQKFNFNEFENFQLNLSLSKTERFRYEWSKKKYIDKCKLFINAIKTEDYNKLILSRIKWVDAIQNPKEQFLYLCNKYPTAFVYLIHFNQQTWLGASPERLVQMENRTLKTVALAGTKAVADNRKWTQKECDEHQIVVDYILDNLSDFKAKSETTETINLGAIEHLQTKISAVIPAEFSIAEICNRLHPTPAVCGMPKAKAKDFILANEGYDRHFYTGYFGLVADDKAEIFVNLRCAQLFSNKTAIYVGGGLLAESNPESEWQETEWKATALL